ncbi:MAG: hypothetical protein H6715_00285 [Myxococcales bacterium]|nr:hypothetical protein [Myxococcales bacterium]MCB9707402.1 hypothetical protein [Myxococcales bacterium]
MALFTRAGFILVLAFASSACAGHSPAPETARIANPDPLRETPGKSLFVHGKSLAKMGDYIRAEQYYRAAIAQGYPKAIVVPYLIGACVAASRMHDALQHARPYLEEHPDEWRLRQVTAFILTALGEHLEAEAELIRVIKDAPSEALPHYALAVLYRDHLDNAELAKQHFLKYVEKAPRGRHAAESKDAAQRLQQKKPKNSDSPRRI